jgi:topoisomerase IV subunit B
MNKAADLFDQPGPGKDDYSAKDIEVLEGLEPVRRRPGMYVGGADERGLHHLAAETLDNSMDEAVAGFATRIDVTLDEDGSLTVRDNGRGIPVDPHPKFKNQSALEVILTTLHAGGKFSTKAYQTSGGLNGVGISVVNALSEELDVEVARDRKIWRQSYSRGKPTGKLKSIGQTQNRRGTTIRFRPDREIFGPTAHFAPKAIYRMARSKAYLYSGVEIRWNCAPSLISEKDPTPPEETFHFPGGLKDFLANSLKGRQTVTTEAFVGKVSNGGSDGQPQMTIEWAVSWPVAGENTVYSYCNTVPTTEGGTHEAGLRSALTKGLKGYAELVNNKRASVITGDDVMGTASAMLSIFISEPQFRGQTKEKLASPEAARLVENAVRDHFDHWLSGAPEAAGALLNWIVDRAEERLKRRKERDVNRKSAARKLRLPGKLADCTRNTQEGTELFIVEGDSAGGSAKSGRARATQAVLPLRGKILNVKSAAAGKMAANQELSDLTLALGCGSGDRYRGDDLRYGKVIIMTDADVDGAHIAALLMTFFYEEMRQLITDGHLYIAVPPLYRLTQGGKTLYARDDAHKDELLEKEFSKRGKVDATRFKGLGEMPPAQLRDTAMAPGKRALLRVELPPEQNIQTEELVESLMGKKPELRFAFIQENAALAQDLDI